MTLRDGMHPQRHQTTVEQMIAISTALDDAGVPLIEVTHGDGLGGSSVNYGFAAATDEEYLSAVVPRMKNAKVSALLLPGIGTVDHLKMAPSNWCFNHSCGNALYRSRLFRTAHHGCTSIRDGYCGLLNVGSHGNTGSIA